MNEVATIEPRPQRAPLTAGGEVRPLVPASFEAAWRFAEMISQSGMAPRGMEKPQQLMAAIVQGLEVGMTPMAAVQSIAVVNGRPTIYGDGAIALVRASGLCEFIEEELVGEGDKTTAVCRAKRKGEKKPVEGRFSVDDARKAALWDKAGPWKQYPKRMLQMRARGFALRDAFADVLKGMILREEAEDYPADARPSSSAPNPDDELRTIEHQNSLPAPNPPTGGEQGGASEVDAPPNPPDEPDMGILLEGLEQALASCSTEDEIFETYENSDIESRLANTESGVDRARGIHDQHVDRVRAIAAKREENAHKAAAKKTKADAKSLDEPPAEKSAIEAYCDEAIAAARKIMAEGGCIDDVKRKVWLRGGERRQELEMSDSEVLALRAKLTAIGNGEDSGA